MDIQATYSPEDNKLRLYPSARLDAETFEKVKAAGFKWAPKQELFVAPKWTPAREDLAIELAGEIEPEEMTLAERAQAKAARLDALADKRARESSAFSRAAHELSERFVMGQPILIGHHSERRARKDKERMDSAMDKAVKASRASDFWLYRAEGVERHANRKNDPRVRARRIKTLLAELRDLQRTINSAHKRRDLLEATTNPETIKKMIGGLSISYDFWSKVDRGDVSPEDARSQVIASATRTIEGPHYARWIAHTLNRLAYERSMLGDVPRFSGDIQATTIQMFVREFGADKPKATKGDGDSWIVECEAPLPVHIGNGMSLELSADDWRDLMQSCGWTPPAKKPAKPPLLNIESPTGFVAVKSHATYRGAEPTEALPVARMAKADYSAIYGDHKGTRLSACGGFRLRITLNPNHTGPRYQVGWAVIFITDQKAHPTPESADFTAPEAAA
jgi:hypothetical protein